MGSAWTDPRRWNITNERRTIKRYAIFFVILIFINFPIFLLFKGPAKKRLKKSNILEDLEREENEKMTNMQ